MSLPESPTRSAERPPRAQRWPPRAEPPARTRLSGARRGPNGRGQGAGVALRKKCGCCRNGMEAPRGLDVEGRESCGAPAPCCSNLGASLPLPGAPRGSPQLVQGLGRRHPVWVRLLPQGPRVPRPAFDCIALAQPWVLSTRVHRPRCPRPATGKGEVRARSARAPGPAPSCFTPASVRPGPAQPRVPAALTRGVPPSPPGIYR